MTALEAEIRSKSIGDRQVLGAVRLSLVPGERVAVVGPSGCGKSTLLRILAGLDTAFDGRVEAGGRPVTRPDPLRVGVMFQEPRLLPWLTVLDNVTLTARRDRDAVDRATRLLDAVGLADRRHALPRDLSGGMAQRVALARALFSRPPVLLLDEPFSAVDALTRLCLRALVGDVARQHFASVLLVTHDVDEAVTFTDRVLVMTDAPGRVIHEVTTASGTDRAALARSVLDALADVKTNDAGRRRDRTSPSASSPRSSDRKCG